MRNTLDVGGMVFPKSIEVTLDPAYLAAFEGDDLLAEVSETFRRHGARWVRREGDVVTASGGVAASRIDKYIGTGRFVDMGVAKVALDRGAGTLTFSITFAWLLWLLGIVAFSVFLGALMRVWLWIPLVALFLWLFVWGVNFSLAAPHFRWLVERFMNETLTGDEYLRPHGVTKVYAG